MREKRDIVFLLVLLLVVSGLVQAQVKPKLMVSLGRDYSKIQPSRFGYLPPPIDTSYLKPTGPQFLTPPSSWDWRAHSGVTPVKDQGTDGTCWAHAALGVLESQKLIKDGVTYDFSEFNLVMCNPNNTTCSSGGNDWFASSFLTANGTVLESCDPYLCGIGPYICKASCPYIINVLGWRMLANNVAELKDAVYNIGPVYTSMYASDPAFSALPAGAVYYYNGNQEPNHAVVIVGYDDNKTHTGGYGAWLIRNSWGTDWSDNGYGWVAYGSAKIGTDSSVYVEYQPYNSTEKIYYYDEKGLNGYFGCGDRTDWGMIKVTPASNGVLQRVDFWVVDINASYKIRVYDNFNGTTLSNLLASQNGNCTKAGYYSVVLTSPPSVSAGNDIFIAVEFTTPGFDNPVPADTQGTVQAGKSYISCDGTTWVDLGIDFSADVGIRARVVPAGGAVCGNSVCEAGENLSNCCQDCGTCGDGVCCPAGGETSGNCPADCASLCDSDNVCDAGENLSNCCQDCGTCGDGICCTADGENNSTCCQDCGGCGGGDCQNVGCNGQAPSGCYCDSECAEYGDCCPDVCSVCGYNCPCVSGACCDPTTGKLRPSTYACETDLGPVQYACYKGPPKGKCGDDVIEGHLNKHCSGSSSSCDGAIDYDWFYHQLCNKRQVCVASAHKCKKKATCAQAESPLEEPEDELFSPGDPVLKDKDEQTRGWGCSVSSQAGSRKFGPDALLYGILVIVVLYLKRRARNRT